MCGHDVSCPHRENFLNFLLEGEDKLYISLPTLRGRIREGCYFKYYEKDIGRKSSGNDIMS